MTVPRRAGPVFLLAVFFYWAAMYEYVPVLPVHARSLGASLTLVGLLVGAYGFSQMVLRIPVGLLSDRWGRRRPFISLGMVAAGAGALGLALAPTAEWLVVWRGVVGVAAASWVASTVLYASYHAPEDTPSAMGQLAFVGGVAQLLATTSGGRLADELGTRAPFFAALGLAAVGLVVSLAIHERPAARSAPPPERLVRVGTMPSLVVISLVAALAQYSSWATTYSFVPIYADALGASKTDLGLLTGASLALYTLATLAVARLVGRFGAGPVTAAGLLLMTASALVVPAIGSVALLALSQAVGGVGRALSATALMSESIRAVEPRERATAMGVFQAVYAIGMFVGPVTAGAVADALGLAGAFWASGLLTLLGAALAIAVVRGAGVKRPEPAPAVSAAGRPSPSRAPSAGRS